MDSDSGSYHSESEFYYPDEENPKRQTHAHAADRLAQLVERRTTVREISGSSPRPDQHSGS